MSTTTNDRQWSHGPVWRQRCTVLALAVLVGLTLAAVPVVGQPPEAPAVPASAADPIRAMEAEAEATGKASWGTLGRPVWPLYFLVESFQPTDSCLHVRHTARRFGGPA